MTVPKPNTAPIFTSRLPQVTPVTSIPTATGSLTIEAAVVDQAGKYQRNQDVQDGANYQRAKDPDRHIALRVARFLGGGRDGVKADIGKENRRRAGRDASNTKHPGPLRGRNEGMPVTPGEFRMVEEESAPEKQKDAHDGQLDDHDRRVEIGRFLDPDDQHRGHDQNGTKGHKVEDTRDMRQRCRIDSRRKRGQLLPSVSVQVKYIAVSGGELRRQMEMQLLQQAYEVSRPTGSNGGRAEGILEHQVPADDPSHQFAQGGIAVGIGGAGNGDDGCELGIAEPRQRRR